MPFTGAHPMAVLPLLRRRWLDATCLVIGAMAPDFEYFARGQEQGNFGHSLVGMFVWGIPVTIVAALLFHGPVKRLLWEVAPDGVAARTAEAARRRWPARRSAGTAVVLVVSAVLGNLTHLAWDSCTHGTGWVVHHFAKPMLKPPVHVPIVGPMALCRVLQYVSSIVGLVVIAWYVVRALRHVPAVNVERRTGPARLLLGVCVALAIATTTARAVWLLHATDPGSLVVAPISGLLAGTLVASAVWTRARVL